MTDLEKVQRMADLNWKPASQYWHELYIKSQAEVEKLKLKIKEMDNT
jgi:hypothetical protein